MEKKFKYIADKALIEDKYSKVCDICAGEKIYSYSGIWVKQKTGEEIEIDAVCEECIQTYLLEWLCEFDLMNSFGADHKVVEINKHIDWNEGEKKRGFLLRYRKEPIWEGKALDLLNKLRKTPTIPLFMQRADWAVCCEDLCEFQGSPENYEELIEIQKNGTYWEHGEGPFAHQRDFIEGGEPESLLEVSEFKCLHCNRQYWIDQYT